MRIARWLTVLACLGLASCTSTQRERELSSNLERTAATLAQREDADSLAAAALLLLPARDEARALLVKATALAPQRADLAWLNTQICMIGEGCDRNAAQARFRAADPGNGVSWMADIDAAMLAGQEQDVDRLLGLIGTSARVDIYWNPLINHLAGAAMNANTVKAAEAVETVIGELAAVSIPAYQGVVRPCRGDALLREGRRALCQAVATRLQQGDTVITENVGTSMAKTLWPEGSPEALAAAEAHRVSRYRMEISGKISLDALSNEKSARSYVDLLAHNRREQDVLLAQVLAAKRNPDPPAEWVDPSH